MVLALVMALIALVAWFIWQFFPGDVGPDGVVLDHLLEITIQGKATYVFDSNTGATLEITIVGTTTDICAAIS